VCEYTYNNIKTTRTPREPSYTLPYYLDLFFETKNPKELLFLDNMNKTIEETLIKLYVLDGAPVISDFKVNVKSAETYTILVNIKIDKESNKVPYTGIKFIAESATTSDNKYKLTEDDIKLKIKSDSNFIKNDENSNNNDIIGDVFSIDVPLLKIKYWRVNYTKLILYPKLN
jgi:hypothetical protein